MKTMSFTNRSCRNSLYIVCKCWIVERYAPVAIQLLWHCQDR